MPTKSPPGQDRACLDAMVAYLRTHLVKTVTFAPGDTITALSETAIRFNDSAWFWTDDNAKAAELLCEPSLYDQEPTAADAAIDFVLRMSKGDMIRRRCGRAELRVVSAEPANFRVETAFTIIEGDLTRGIVRHALRFNDNRTATVAQHGPARLSFRHGWLPLGLKAAESISSHEISHTPESATLSHTTNLHRPALGPRARRPLLGTLTYIYTIPADSPCITLTLKLVPADGIVLDNVVLGTALHGLHQNRHIHYRTVAVRHLGRDRHIGSIRGQDTTIHRGAADYVAVVQGGTSPGFSYAIHSLLNDGSKLARITTDVHKRGRLRDLSHLYRLGRVEGEARLTEHRMITGGGYYDTLENFSALMANPHQETDRGTADPSMTYDIGAELNAIAVYILFARRGRYANPPEPARLDGLAAWYDRHVQRYFDVIRPGSSDELDRVFTRGLAFVVLSLDCMVRATSEPRYRAMLETGVRLILATQRRHVAETGTYLTFGDTWARNYPFLDNHAACILALARAAWHGDAEATIARAIHEAVRGIRFHTATIDIGDGHMLPYDGLAVLNPPEARPHVDTGFWHYKLGLTLRALHAILAAADADILPASSEERLQTQLRIDIGRSLLAASFRTHGTEIESLTSRLAGETNSETQPWVALGLFPMLDEQIVSLKSGRFDDAP